MAYGLDAPVLVLNRNYQPVRVTRARRALTLLYVGTARALDRDYAPHSFHEWLRLPPAGEEESIGVSTGTLRIPRILLLDRYGRVPRSAVRLSRRNVYLRDGFTCQYCGERKGVCDLNLDHVTPRCRGGRSTWENLVTSCKPCNFRKGSEAPEEAGMHLLRRPVRPGWRLAATLQAMPRRFEEWAPFVGAGG